MLIGRIGRVKTFYLLSLIIPLIVLLPACCAPPRAEPDPTAIPTAEPYDGGESKCDHPFFPMKAGSYWEFETTGTGFETIRWEVTRMELTTNTATAVMSRLYDSFSSLYTIDCSPSGIVPLVTTNPTIGPPSPVYPRLLVERTLHLPPVALLQPGYSWDGNSYEIGEGGGMNGIVHVWTETYRVVGTDPVLVDGLAYQGLQIIKTFEERATGEPYIPINYRVDVKTEGEIAFTLARGVGVVKAVTTARQTDVHGLTQPTPGQWVAEVTLIDYSIP